MGKQIIKSGTVSFYTIGSDFTRLLRDLVREGVFRNVILILKDGGFDTDKIKEFFEHKIAFEGDSRDENGLLVVPSEPHPNFNQFFYESIRESLLQDDMQMDELYEAKERSKHIQELLTVYTWQEIVEIIKYPYLKNEGYGIAENEFTEAEDGAILQDGTFVTCGYQQHRYLYPVLALLDLASSGDWCEDEKTIHISSGQFSGKIGYSISNNFREEEIVTSAQIMALFKFRKSIRAEYGVYERCNTLNAIKS